MENVLAGRWRMIEYARNVLGIKDATSEEFGQGTFIVKKLPQLKVGIKRSVIDTKVIGIIMKLICLIGKYRKTFLSLNITLVINQHFLSHIFD